MSQPPILLSDCTQPPSLFHQIRPKSPKPILSNSRKGGALRSWRQCAFPDLKESLVFAGAVSLAVASSVLTEPDEETKEFVKWGEDPDINPYFRYFAVSALSAVPLLHVLPWFTIKIGRDTFKYPLFGALYTAPIFLCDPFHPSAGGASFKLAVFSYIASIVHLQVFMWKHGLNPLHKLTGNGTSTKEIQEPKEKAADENTRVKENNPVDLDTEILRIESDRKEENEGALNLWDQKFALRSLNVAQLREVAREKGVKGRSKMRKAELIQALERMEDVLDSMDVPDNPS